MAIFSQDPQMLEIFNNDEDFHSHTGSAISGIGYLEFMERKRRADPVIVSEDGLRYCGKFVGLSNQYRVGAKQSRIMARVQYLNITALMFSISFIGFCRPSDPT